MNVTHPIDGGLPSWLIASTTMPFSSTPMSVQPPPVLASILAILPDWLRSVLAAIAPGVVTVSHVSSLVLQIMQAAATRTRARPKPVSCPTNSGPTPDEAAQTTSLLGRLPIWRRIKVGAIGVIAQYGVRRDGVGSARDTVDTAPSEVDPAGTEHGPAAEFALRSAHEWIRVGGTLAEFRAWRHAVPWGRLAPDDRREILSAAVEDRIATDDDPASVVDTLPYWLWTVAPLIYEDAVERLEWFAALVPSLVQHPISGERLREVRDAVDGWATEVDHEDNIAVFLAREALTGIALLGPNPTESLGGSVASASTNLDRACGWSDPPAALRAAPMRTHSAGWVTEPRHGPTDVILTSRNSSMEVCVDEEQLQVCTDQLRRRMAVADAPSKPRSLVGDLPRARPIRALSQGWGVALLQRVQCAVAELGRWATDRVPLGRSAPVLALNAGARGP